jgi:hypothetical protein
MTAIEHKELKGITVKNLVVTIVSTASIVASVMTTYFGLKNDIREVKTSQETETRINNIRLKILEGQVVLLQKEVDEIKFADRAAFNAEPGSSQLKKIDPALLSSTDKPELPKSVKRRSPLERH